MNIRSAITDLYDAHVGHDADGAKLSEVREALREDVRVLLADTPRDLDSEADTLISEVLATTRGARSRNLKKHLGYLLDGFDESGPYIDPYLDLAFPTGDQHGIDKTLRNWTPRDFEEVVITRYRVAAESTKAASDLDETTRLIVDRMSACGATRVGDVRWSA